MAGVFLSESLAKKGANVTAIDTARSLIDIAKKRAIKEKLNINYKIGDMKALKIKN